MIKKAIATFVAGVMALTCICFPASAQTYPTETNNSSISSDFWRSASVRVQSDALILSKTTLLEADHAETVSYSLQNGQESENGSYVNELVMVIPKEECSVEDVYDELCERYDSSATRGTGNITESGRDSSISIEATLTIYFTKTTVNNMPYVKLTKVEGGFTQLDRQVKVVSQVVEMGCTGWAAGGVKTQTIDLLDYGDTTSWVENMPSNWVPVADNGYTIFSVGANVIFTLRRKSSSDHTWKLRLYNTV